MRTDLLTRADMRVYSVTNQTMPHIHTQAG